jgi:co-chaperonin GroES (HSP10)
MKLLHDNILAEIIKFDNKTASGIILDDKAVLNKYEAKVIAIGNKVEHVKIGDTIRYNANSGTNFTLNNEKCVFLRENRDVILVLQINE